VPDVYRFLSCKRNELYCTKGQNLSRDSNFNLDARLQADASNLLDDLAGRVEVDQALVHLEFETIPGLRTFTARRFTCSDLQDLGRQADRTFNTKLLVLGSVDKIRREFLQVPDVATRQSDTDFVDFCAGHWSTSSIVFFFTLSDVTHCKFPR